ncbi:MAG: hypothetical protein K9M03_04740 [Kiritimatiellales bacterium]|nr:hypothetical protein [Kiritimatiellales bacterium]
MAKRIISDLEKRYEITASELLGGHMSLIYNRHPNLSFDEAVEATVRHFVRIIGERKPEAIAEIQQLIKEKPFPWKLVGQAAYVNFKNEEEGYEWFKKVYDIFMDENSKMEAEQR